MSKVQRTYLDGNDTATENESSDEDIPFATIATKYRDTTIGVLLTESLEQLKEEKMMSGSLADKVLRQFDRTMVNLLKTHSTPPLLFKASKLKTYCFLDGMWTFVLDHTEFREHFSFANVPKVKVLAFEASVPLLANKNKHRRHAQDKGEQRGSPT